MYRAAWLNTPVVVKFMGFEVDEGAHRGEMFFHELRVWFPLRHPHVVKLFGACHVDKRFFVCEFAGNGTLDAYLKRDGNANRSWELLHQVGLGLEYLHEQNVLHNDLKCNNVLIGADGKVKITDFGLSCIFNSAEVKVDVKKQGALQWKSPEYTRVDRLTLKPDVYEFAMLILEAVTGEPPWGQRVDDAVVRFHVKKEILPLWSLAESLNGSQWV